MIYIYCNENDQENPYIKSIIRYNKKVLDSQFDFQIKTNNQSFAKTNICHPSVILRPYDSVVVFTNPFFDLEGYHTYFSGGLFTPPVVKAIISNLDLTINNFTIVGSGIGMYLAMELKKLKKSLRLISHNDLLLMKKDEVVSNNVINCSRISVDGCLINLCDNPLEISKSTVVNLFNNIEISQQISNKKF